MKINSIIILLLTIGSFTYANTPSKIKTILHRIPEKEAVDEIIKLCRGNFRLFNRLFFQVKKTMQAYGLRFLSKEIISKARENFILGKI